jgi:CHAT domain-containing protein
MVETLRSLFEKNRRWELQRLEYSSREVIGIAKRYKPDEVAVYLGSAAKEENVKNNEYLSTARRIHFATHGIISEKQPQYSGLVLTLDDDPTEDGLLQAYEIFNLKLNADLVVLSACRTGLGKEVRGEGLIGLTRAFMYAGAPSVVVSLWEVADRSTAALMVKFYQQLDHAKDKAEALRQAKLALIQSGQFAHPYYWAPFILVGEPK